MKTQISTTSLGKKKKGKNKMAVVTGNNAWNITTGTKH